MSDFYNNPNSQAKEMEELQKILSMLKVMAASVGTWSGADVQRNVTVTQVGVSHLNRQLKNLPQQQGRLLREQTAQAGRAIAVELHNKHRQTQMALDYMNFLYQEFDDLLDMRKRFLEDMAALKKQLPKSGSAVGAVPPKNDPFKDSSKNDPFKGSPNTDPFKNPSGTGSSGTGISGTDNLPKPKKKGGFLKVMAVLTALVLGVLIFLNVKGTSAYKAGDYYTAIQYLSFTPFGRDTLQDACKTLGDAKLEAGEYAEASSYYSTAGNALKPQADYCKALSIIEKAVTSNYAQIANLRSASDYLETCGDIWEAKTYRVIIMNLLEENYTNAAKAIRELPNVSKTGISGNDWKKLLSGILYGVKADNLEDGMDLLYARWLCNGKRYTDEEFRKALHNEKSSIAELPETIGDIPVKQSELKNYGGDPQGKVLVTRQFHSFEGSITTAVSLDLMEYLPEQYLPTSLDQVEYVINIKYDYMKDPTGYYGTSTQALMETGVIEIKKLKSGAILYTSDEVRGAGAPSYATYYGAPPEFLSGGKPNMSSTFIEVMKELKKLA